jgi:choline-sulfatase
VHSLPNVASVLAGEGYDVYWKGKWHLSFPVGFKGGPPSDGVWSHADIAAFRSKYDMRRWNPPDASTAAGAYMPSAAADAAARASTLRTTGGGVADNDGRYVSGILPGTRQAHGFGESALDLIGRLGKTRRAARRPFAIFISLVNPHDITDDLANKPGTKSAYRQALEAKVPFRDAPDTPVNYVNFYARLHATVEPHTQLLLDALERHGLTRDAIIFRTADHGELGLSQACEKAYTAYEEMIRVPLVVSNPVLYPRPMTTDALYSSCRPDADAHRFGRGQGGGRWKERGSGLARSEPRRAGCVLFAFDDSFLLGDVPGSHIRALRDARWTYAVYYGSKGGRFEYELYDNAADPGRLSNLTKQPSAANTIARHCGSASSCSKASPISATIAESKKLWGGRRISTVATRLSRLTPISR